MLVATSQVLKKISTTCGECAGLEVYYQLTIVSSVSKRESHDRACIKPCVLGDASVQCQLSADHLLKQGSLDHASRWPAWKIVIVSKQTIN